VFDLKSKDVAPVAKPTKPARDQSESGRKSWVTRRGGAWGDVMHLATLLDGVRLQITSIDEAIGEMNVTNKEECEQCLKSLDLFSGALRKLRLSLKSKLQ
jgi:hypothetical protein